MIDSFLHLIDRIIQLIKDRDKASHEVLALIVEPLFAEMALVVNDYLSLYLETLEVIGDDSDESLTMAIRNITARRQELLTTRIKVREMARTVGDSFRNQQLVDFAEEILHFFHSSRIVAYRTSSTPSTSLKVELHEFVERPDLDRSALKSNIEQALRNIEINWASVTRAYCRVKITLV